MIEALKAAAGVGVLAWYGSSLYVGARLLHVGTRDGHPPARWIGTYLFFAMGLGSILYSIAMAKTVLAGAPMTSVDRVLMALHHIAAIVANFALLTFTRHVFRPDSALAPFATAAILLMLVVGSLGHALTADLDGNFTATAYGTIYLAGPVLVNAWAATESLLYYRSMRKRLELGLAEPIEANRFLLWGLGAGSAAFLLLFNLVQMKVQHLLGSGLGLALRATSLTLLAVLGLACAACYLCAFFPPRWYVARFASAPSQA
jgi:hypothetical protein